MLCFFGSEFLFSEGGHKRRPHDESDYIVNSGKASECSVHNPYPGLSFFIELYSTVFCLVFQIGLCNLVSQLIKGRTCVRFG